MDDHDHVPATQKGTPWPAPGAGGTAWPLAHLDVHRRCEAPRTGHPYVVDGAIDGDLFVAYVEQQLVPVLRLGEVAVMDNIGSHKVQDVRKAI